MYRTQWNVFAKGDLRELIPTPTTPDGHETNKGAVLRGIVLDCRSGQDAEVKVYECYCFQTRQLMVIKTSRGLCKSWEITFSIKSRDDNGICDVNIEKVSENSPMETKGEVVLGRDGAVRIRTYVGASECPQHESYDEKILWSDKFQRVRRGQDDGPLEKSAIYSTYVERDTSKEAIAKGVAFRISDLLKKVIDEDTIKRCQDQMLADQDILNAEANSSTDAFGNVEQPVRELLTATLLMNKLEIKDKGRLCKSWRVTFTIKNTNSDGVYDVNIAKKDGNPPDAEKGDIFLSRDGFVIMKTYVGASMCIHHESHEGIVLWSDKFGRVLYANEEKLATTTIYSTYVRRDGSRLAASYAVEFRICETLKPVADKDVVQRCQIQLFEDQNLMLCIRADKIKTKAWNAEYGCILVEETSRETESGLFFYVKRVDEPADPLAYTYWVRDILQIELQLDISLVEKLANGMVIAENPYVGKIEMEQEAYDMISSQRMVGTLRFNDFNKEVPWTFVEIIRTLEPREDFPISSPECRVSDHVRTRAKNESRRPPSSRSDRYRPHPNASAQYRPQSSGTEPMSTGRIQIEIIRTGLSQAERIITGLFQMEIIKAGLNQTLLMSTGLNRAERISTGLIRMEVISTGLIQMGVIRASRIRPHLISTVLNQAERISTGRIQVEVIGADLIQPYLISNGLSQAVLP
ncbi:unnamed protein product [Haemonchus placei]|uniref:Ig-like domain-containing protein n=1 Tax=Haemonchus placei TaxID=6290 RepID=A0A0N4WE24_HAEPC|nr:unnamed protein product [Haemonchus placei]